MPRQLVRDVPVPASVALRRYPVQVQGTTPVEAMRALDFSTVQARRAYRSYFGRGISLNLIEVALRQAWRGNMRALTDISRETLDVDPHLASVVSKRVDALAGLPWEIHPATGANVDPDKALFYAAVVREQLASMRNLRKTFKQLAWALYDGRAVLEKKWIPIKGVLKGPQGQYARAAIECTGWIHPRRISFGPLRELRVTDEYVGLAGDFSSYGLAIDQLPYKFISWTPQLFGEYPEREGLAPRCLYWSFFKRFGARERMILLELFGKPWRIVTVDKDSPAGDPELKSADEIVDELGSSYTARMPRGTELQVVQPQRTAGAIHEDVIAESDRQISKLVLGQTGTTDALKGGFNNQQASVMQDEQFAKLQSDASEFSDMFEDQFTDEIIAVNFGEEETPHAPKFVLRSDRPVNRKEELERLDAALKAGLAIAVQEAYTVSGFRVPDEGEAVLQVEQPPTQPNSPVAPAPRPVVVYPAGKSPPAGEQQPTPPIAGTGAGAAPFPASGAGAGAAEKTVTVNEDRAARNLPPIADGDMTITEYEKMVARRNNPDPLEGGAVQGQTNDVPDKKPGPGKEPQSPSQPEPAYAQPAKPQEQKTAANDTAGLPIDDPSYAADDAKNKRVKVIPKIADRFAALSASVELMIKHEGKKWVVYSEDGEKKLGEYDTKAEALKRLRQIEYFKHKKASADAKAALEPLVGEAAAAEVAASVLSVRGAELELLLAPHSACSHGVELSDDAAQPTTKYGTPDDIIDAGAAEGRRATAKMAAALEAAVAGKTTAGDIFSAVAKARHSMDLHPFARAVERRLVHAAALGALDAALMDSITAAEPKEPGSDFSRSPYDAALRAFKAKNVVRKPVFANMEAKAKMRAFTVAGLAADGMVATVHDELVAQVAKGADIREFKAAMARRLKDAGWVAQLETLPDGRRALSASHVDTIFRTNVLGAYNAGRAAQMSEPEVVSRRPVWQWRTVGDPHVRPNHAQADGIKMLASDSFWQRCYPPAGFRCRCRVVSLPGGDLSDVVHGSTITYLPDEGFVSGLSSAL